MRVHQEIAILGLLKQGPKHGYQIKKLLKNVLRVFTSFESTSIYYPLKSLEEKDYLKKRISKKGPRPKKYVYELTPKGEGYLKDLLINNFLSLNRPFVNVDLSLYFLPYVDREVFIRKVRIRLKALERIRRWLLKRLETFNIDRGLHLKKIFEHNLKLVDAEIEFTKDLLESKFS